MQLMSVLRLILSRVDEDHRGVDETSGVDEKERQLQRDLRFTKVF